MVRHTRPGILQLALLLGAVQGCESRLTLTGSESSDSTPTEPGTVSRANLAVAVTLSGEASVLASRLGWAQGVLPGALVVVTRDGGTEGERQSVTDDAGVARFDSLLEGRYAISALRTLTQEQIEQLDAADQDVTGFGGAIRFRVVAPDAHVAVSAAAGRRGSLVISEVFTGRPLISDFQTYSLATYIELYNNSDTLIYLDGKVLVRVMVFGVRDRNETFNCETMARWQFDPEGLWTGRFVEAFPGAGRSHPLAPGRAVVVATDAIDHGEVVAGLPDLNFADFEFIGEADVDNPAVRNMVNLGRTCGLDGSHGCMLWTSLDYIYAIADTLDVAALFKEDVPGALSPEHWQVPKGKILDVVTVALTPEVEAALDAGAQCPTFVHESFDRQQAPLSDSQNLRSVQRRVMGVLPDGRKVLLRTKTSSRDLLLGPMSPGSVP